MTSEKLLLGLMENETFFCEREMSAAVPYLHSTKA